MSQNSEQEFSRAVVLSNPTKRGTEKYEAANRQVEHAIDALGLPREDIETDRDPQETQRRILGMVTRHDLLFVLGGDGTINAAVQALIEQDKDERAALIATAAGTANDFYRNHNGGKEIDALTNAILQGKWIDIHPMEIETTAPDSTSLSRVAVNNAGVGYTAEVAELLNSPAHRDSKLRSVPVIGQLAQEALTTVKSLSNLETVPITDDGEPQSIDLLDRTFVHAKTAAKYGKYDSSHTDPEFLQIDGDKAPVPAVLVGAAKTFTGRPQGRRVTDSEFVVGENTVGHVDGETFPVPAGTNVRVSLSEQAFRTPSLQHN